MSVREAAEQLKVHVSTVIAWCHSGRLDGVQGVPHGPWWVHLTREQIAALRSPSQEYRTRGGSKEGKEAVDPPTSPKAVR